LRNREVTTLEEYVGRLGRCYRALRAVYEDFASGRIRLVDPDPPVTFAEYVVRLDYSLWFWTLLTLVAVAVASVYLSDLLPPIAYVRYVAGSILVLFAVGYATVEALYPEGGLSDLEVLALSIGLSLALVPLIGLVLNYTPWGIRLGPVLVSLTIYTASVALAAEYRKYSHLRPRQAVQGGRQGLG
jgi:uncharacterized membrane protein